MESSLLNLVAGSASFTGSAVFSLISNFIHNNLTSSEEDKKRQHEIVLKSLELQEKDNKAADKDRSEAREQINERDKTRGFLGGSFTGWTRRVIAWTVPLLVVFLLIASYSVHGINIVTPIHHNLLDLIQWTSIKVTHVTGFMWPSWFKLWFFMIGGFYFGRQPRYKR